MLFCGRNTRLAAAAAAGGAEVVFPASTWSLSSRAAMRSSSVWSGRAMLLWLLRNSVFEDAGSHLKIKTGISLMLILPLLAKKTAITAPTSAHRPPTWAVQNCQCQGCGLQVV